jgi:hypothetical protein
MKLKGKIKGGTLQGEQKGESGNTSEAKPSAAEAKPSEAEAKPSEAEKSLEARQDGTSQTALPTDATQPESTGTEQSPEAKQDGSAIEPNPPKVVTETEAPIISGAKKTEENNDIDVMVERLLNPNIKGIDTDIKERDIKISGDNIEEVIQKLIDKKDVPLFILAIFKLLGIKRRLLVPEAVEDGDTTAKERTILEYYEKKDNDKLQKTTDAILAVVERYKNYIGEPTPNEKLIEFIDEVLSTVQ